MQLFRVELLYLCFWYDRKFDTGNILKPQQQMASPLLVANSGLIFASKKIDKTLEKTITVFKLCYRKRS